MFGGACLALFERNRVKRTEQLEALHKLSVLLARTNTPTAFNFRRQFALRLFHAVDPEFGSRSLHVLKQHMNVVDYTYGSGECVCSVEGESSPCQGCDPEWFCDGDPICYAATVTLCKPFPDPVVGVDGSEAAVSGDGVSSNVPAPIDGVDSLRV